MTTATDYLFDHLTDRTADLIKAVSVHRKFGPDNRPHARDLNAHERLQRGVSAVMAAIECLNAQFKRDGLEEIIFDHDEEIDREIDNIYKLAEYSAHEGVLKEVLEDHRNAAR